MIVSAVPGTIVPQMGTHGAILLARVRTQRAHWLSDSDILDDNVRHFLRAYTTPRRGSNGQICWPLDEVCSDD